MEKCPVCGSSLVWDYEEGFVVCSACGLVVDRVYEYAHAPDTDEGEAVRGRRRGPRSVIDRKTYRFRLRLYNKAYKIAKEKPWMVVDTDRVLETGRFVNTVKSKASIAAEKNIEKEGVKTYVERGLEIIRRENPALLSRSLRGRYALAYMVAYAASTRVVPPEDFVTKVFNISSTSYKRLKSITVKLLGKDGGLSQMPGGVVGEVLSLDTTA
ncbi:TFIIB-type zinc ribbon-containing protein [Thermogladius sp.]|uniref:TFIIB-type zinc ribbon-containing protein n=1 Tax=Thermogladius sp. TaxID=2023064 RepID=UPI003D10DE7E